MQPCELFLTFAYLKKCQMKNRIIIGIIMLLTGFLPVSAQTMSERQAAKMDSMAVALFKDGNFKKSIELMNKWLADRQQAKGEQDSLYIQRTALLAKAYFRDQQLDKAISSIDKAMNLYAKYKSDNDTLYAFYLDNKKTTRPHSPWSEKPSTSTNRFTNAISTWP